jgi:cell division septal protein FtsQ
MFLTAFFRSLTSFSRLVNLLTVIFWLLNLNYIIITKTTSKQLQPDIKKYQAQYNNLKIKKSNNYHDRFLIIDKTQAYHIGASLKDLGKKVFAFSKIDKNMLR